MTDRELLELAAKAASIKALIDPHGALRDCTSGDPAMNIFAAPRWNPLTDDGDALRLAVKLKLHLTNGEGYAWASSPIVECTEPFAGNPYAATRRAIVRAAAEIGRAMK